jgi:predicted porin
MKNVLIGSTALLAASLIAGPVLADGAPLSASNVDLTLGGQISMTAHYQSKQPTKVDTDKERNHALDLDGEMHFMGEAATDTGLEFGFEVEFEIAGAGAAAGGDFVDENWIWVDGRFGKIYMGGRDAEELDGNGDNETYSGVGKLTADSGANEASSFGDTIDQGAENNKISWLLPEMGGLQLAINYTPDLAGQDTTGTTDNDDTGTEEKELHIAAQYEMTLGTADIGIDVGYAKSSTEMADGLVDAQIGSNSRWRIAAQVEVDDFEVGAFWKSYSEYAKTATTWSEDRETVGLTAEYVVGAWTVGASWRQNTADETDQATPNVHIGEDKATQVNFGVEYELNDDMLLKVGYENANWEDDLSAALNENSTDSVDIKFEWDVFDGLEFDIGYQNFSYTHHDITAAQSGPSANRTGHALTVFTEVTF